MEGSGAVSKKSTKKTIMFAPSMMVSPSQAKAQDFEADVRKPPPVPSIVSMKKSMGPMNQEIAEMYRSAGKLFKLTFTFDEDESEELQDEEEEMSDENIYDPNHIDNLFKRDSFIRLDSKTDMDLFKLESQAQVSVKQSVTMSQISLDRMHGLTSPGGSKMDFLNAQKSFVTVFESLALFSILEEVCLQLTILGHSFPGGFVKSEHTDFLTYDERFSTEVAEKDLEYIPALKHFKNPFIIDQAKIGTPEERLAMKIQKDRAFLQEIINQAREEVITDRSFEKLKGNVTREDGRRHEEITLMERAKKAHRAVNEMLQKIKNFKLQMERDEHNRKEMINHLKDQLHQEKQKGLQNARYTLAFFEAKNTFNYGELEHRADLNRLKIKDLEIQMTRDRMAHKNIEAWSLLMFEELQQRINGWTEKFEKDLEEMERKIRDKNDVVRGQLTLIEGLNNTIAERMVELGPWEEEKERERQERIANLRLYYMARKIQRWWRAYMKKHKLYKKKKGRRGKDAPISAATT